MTLVAATALGTWIVLGAMRLSRKAMFYRMMAASHSRSEQTLRQIAAREKHILLLVENAQELRRRHARDDRDQSFVTEHDEILEHMKEDLRNSESLADWYRGRALKYGHAAKYPWLSVAFERPPLRQPP
jgi:hypothetical protein